MLLFLHADLHQDVEQQNLVDPFVGDMNSIIYSIFFS